MSLASSLERKLKAAVNALANGGFPKPVNVIRNGGSEPSPEPTPAQDPLPSNAHVSSGGLFTINGMVGATVSFKKDGEVLVSGTISSEGLFSEAHVDKEQAAGTVLDITVTLEGYQDWNGTVTVQGGK
jgi:hypothetical protein